MTEMTAEPPYDFDEQLGGTFAMDAGMEARLEATTTPH